MHQIRFRLGGSAPDPAGELTALPRPLAEFEGPTSKGGEGKGEGVRGEGREAFLVMWPRRLSALNPPWFCTVKWNRIACWVSHFFENLGVTFIWE